MTKKDEIERILKNASFEASFKIKMTAKWQYCLQYLFVAWVRPCVADWTVRNNLLVVGYGKFCSQHERQVGCS